MQATMPRDATAADLPAILALNLASEHLLSPLDAERLRLLHAQSAYHRVVEDADGIAGFLLAFREGADYDSPNYRWFVQHYPRFLYIDRIAIADGRQGRGLGAQLYRDLFAFARASGLDTVACEFYSAPLNEGSLRFHASQGFHEVGRQWLANGKQVSFQVATP